MVVWRVYYALCLAGLDINILLLPSSSSRIALYISGYLTRLKITNRYVGFILYYYRIWNLWHVVMIAEEENVEVFFIVKNCYYERFRVNILR